MTAVQDVVVVGGGLAGLAAAAALAEAGLRVVLVEWRPYVGGGLIRMSIRRWVR